MDSRQMGANMLIASEHAITVLAAGAAEAAAVKETIARSRRQTLKMRYLPTPEEEQTTELAKAAQSEVVDLAMEADLVAACIPVER